MILTNALLIGSSEQTMANRKQLYVLLGMAGWICVANLIALAMVSGWDSEVGGFVIRSFALCLPALLFGGILLWWFTKKRP